MKILADLESEKLEKYNKNDGMICPFCESSNLEYGDSKWTSEGFTGNLKCFHCGAEWIDVATRTSVFVLDDGSKNG